MAGTPIRDLDPWAINLVLVAGAYATAFGILSTMSLEAENGPSVAITLFVPLALVVIFAVSVLIQAWRAKPLPGLVAKVVTVLCLVFAVVGMLTIGPFVIPIGALLLVSWIRLDAENLQSPTPVEESSSRAV